MPFTPEFVCQNPSCRSYGRRHPHCRCGPEEYAAGGDVHCSSDRTHDSKCEHFAEGDEVHSNRAFANDPSLAIDNSVAHHGLLHTLSRTGYTKSTEPGRAHSEFLDAHRNGHKAVHQHTGNTIDKKAPRYKPDHSKAEALEAKLDELRANPDKALMIGGDIGDTLPNHHALLAAKAATAMSYLESIKPKPTPAGALDKPVQPSHADMRSYQRQVAIAEDPKLILHYVKEGTLVPKDLETLTALYPKLQKQYQDAAFETLAKAEASGRTLTHKEKRKLGLLVGQPVVFEQTPMAIAAIMHANSPPQMPQPGGKAKKASSTELNQINKVNELSQTPLQRLQARQK